MIRLSDPNEKILAEMSKAKWEQCICGKWFIAKHGRQKYCSPKCRNRWNAKVNRERNKSDYHYISKGGVMYERSNNDGASGY